jgi:hypothetical protein
MSFASVISDRTSTAHQSYRPAVKRMNFLNLRKSERLKIEAYVILLLAITVLVFSLPGWLKVLLVSVIAGVSWHLLFDPDNTTGLWKGLKLAIGLGAVAVIATTIWNFDFAANVPALLSDPAKADQDLKSDTAVLVKRLREFQQEIDDWNRLSVSRMETDVKNTKSADSADPLARAKELGGSMAKLDNQFKTDLKPQIIAIQSRLLRRVPPKSVPPSPAVEWSLQYGFSTFPNAVGNIADYLEGLAGMLPTK